jgi:hypothetical protein
MLELGKAGSAGVQKGELPVLRDGVVVARLRAANWKEQATVVVGDREWVFAKQKREFTACWAADPEGTARLRARQTSFWKGTWEVELAGTVVERRTVSMWKGTHRYLAGDREIAATGTTGGWTPRPTLTGELPLDDQVFLLWLEHVINRRNTAAVAGGAGAAVVAGGS